MINGPAGLEALEVDALRTDRYLEALLSASEHGAGDVPAATEVDPALRSAARHLRDELVRVHPSFRFEERLAQRLATAASRMRLAAASGAGADAPVVPFPGPLLDDPDLVAELANPALAAFLAGEPGREAGRGFGNLLRPGLPGRPQPGGDPAGRAAMSRQVLVGGALTSAALSLAGAAFVAWRRTRGAPSDPMARAVRAARAARDAGRTAGTALDIVPRPGAARRPRTLS